MDLPTTVSGVSCHFHENCLCKRASIDINIFSYIRYYEPFFEILDKISFQRAEKLCNLFTNYFVLKNVTLKIFATEVQFQHIGVIWFKFSR